MKLKTACVLCILTVTAGRAVHAQIPADYTHTLEARLAGDTHVVTGAAIGFVAGAGAAYLLLYRGGSTSRCDRDANQDALNRRECLGLVAAGGVIGGALGALVGRRVRRGPAPYQYHDLGAAAGACYRDFGPNWHFTGGLAHVEQPDPRDRRQCTRVH